MFPEGDFIVCTSVTGPCFGAQANTIAAAAIADRILFMYSVIFYSITNVALGVTTVRPSVISEEYDDFLLYSAVISYDHGALSSTVTVTLLSGSVRVNTRTLSSAETTSNLPPLSPAASAGLA